MRRCAVLLAGILVATLAGCAPSTPDRYSARTLAAAFPETGCPSSLGSIADVSAEGSVSDALMSAAPRPRAALVCAYAGSWGPTSSPARALARSTRLDATEADRLAAAAAAVDVTEPPDGAVACPADLNTATVITFVFRRKPATSLWWATTGCQFLDNGRVRASLLANPSFAHFDDVFAEVIRHSR